MPQMAFESSAVFRVKVSDLDVNLHTNNVNYLRWVSDLTISIS
jgi:acyl-ACP thioesterase